MPTGRQHRACACGSGIPVTTVVVDGQTIQIMALAPILELAYGQGLRAGRSLPEQIMATVRVYNEIPAGEEARWAQAVEPGLAGVLRRQGRAGIRNGSGVILMANTATYTTEVAWKGEHLGHLVMGNGPEMAFSAPPDAHGHAGVLTPEDAFVAAANTCIMMMFLWACERFKLDLVSYRCRAEGTKRIELDRTEIFTHLRFWPEIVVRAGARRRSGAGPRSASARRWPRRRSTAWWPIP